MVELIGLSLNLRSECIDHYWDWEIEVQACFSMTSTPTYSYQTCLFNQKWVKKYIYYSEVCIENFDKKETLLLYVQNLTKVVIPRW